MSFFFVYGYLDIILCFYILCNALIPAFPQCAINHTDINEYKFSATFIMAVFYYVNML